MPFTRQLATAFAVVAAAVVSLGAQNAQAADVPTVQAPSVAANSPQPATTAAPERSISFVPTAANASVGVHASAATSHGAYQPEHEHMSNSVTMMIVGGAVLIVGAVVGGTPGTIIMIGGGTVGIIGLIRYLQ